MPKPLNLSGQKFGRLSVLSMTASRDGMSVWNCLCECGQSADILGKSLVRGNTKSCGCLRREQLVERNTTHGMSEHSAFECWIGMRKRCFNVASSDYADYGGRGILPSPEWEFFATFWKDMGPTWKAGLTLDRIDVNGPYSKENCRWATRLDQANNKRNNRFLDTPNGRMTFAQAVRFYGLTKTALWHRIRRGWSTERLFTPLVA